MATKIGPLQGVKVVEVCMFQQAPVCFAMMADMGADVIKIEPPKTGELGRRLGPFHSSGIGGYFENNNRSKRSLTIDFRKKEGLEILHQLAGKADVFAQNYRPGVAERRGFAYEDIVKVNPSIVYISMSAYGERGPGAMLPGVDGIAQAMGGIASTAPLGEDGGMKTLSFAVADQTAAFLNCIGVLAALYRKRMTGEGQKVETSLLGGQIALMGHSMMHHLLTGVLATPGAQGRVRGMPGPSIGGCFIAKDGKSFLFSVLTTHYDNFFKVMGLEELRKESRFDTPDKIAENREEFLQVLRDFFKTKDRDEWVRTFREGGLICAPIYNYAEAAADPDVLANEYITELDHPKAGHIRVVGPPWHFSKTPVKPGVAPVLGQHNSEVLKELGYSDAGITRLKKEEVI